MSSAPKLGIAVIGDALPASLIAQLKNELPEDVLWLQVVSQASVIPAAGWQSQVSASRGSTLVRELRARMPATLDLLLLDADCAWPEAAWARFRHARSSASEAAVLSPLCCSAPALSPLPPGLRLPLDHATIDRHLCWRSELELLPIDTINPAASLWMAGCVDESPALALPYLFIDRHNQPVCGAELPRDLREAVPENALAHLRSRWSEQPLPAGPRPRFDSAAVYLHIIHGWGGGAAGFVRDFASTRTDEVHLVLEAEGRFASQHYGEHLRLSLVTPDAFVSLSSWPLAPTIGHSARTNSGYQRRLQAICARYGVDRVLVSSLIGHSLDALRLPLPTVVVQHDYYPLWPNLHENFDDSALDASDAALAHALPKAASMFGEHTVSDWRALRSDFVTELTRRQLPLVVPSQGMIGNLLRIAPTLPTPSVIAHGFRPFDQPQTVMPKPRSRLRVLVLGRINGGKGEHLLAELLRLPHDAIEFFLIGCGKSGERFFGLNQVHVLLDYQREQLPALLAGIAPDLALMPVTVAESFSFTLSELWALGIVPVASRMGSLAERIEDGVDGLLVAPNAHAIADCLRGIQTDQNRLQPIRRQISARQPRSLQAMRADYEPLFARGSSRPAWPDDSSPTYADDIQALAARSLRAEYLLRELEPRLAHQERELAKRGAWAHELDRQLQDSAGKLKRLQLEHETLSQVVHEQEARVEERTQWAMTLQTETERLGALLSQTQDLHQRDNRNWAQEVERLNKELQAIQASTSWQLTRPLRAVVRRLRDLRTRVRYLVSRFAGNVRRLAGYWRRQGMGATLTRARQEFASPAVTTTPLLPAAPDEAPELGDLRFAIHESPTVSIIIPVYNKFAYTAACLRSLQAIGASLTFEVIVVDDGSSDETEARLNAVPGLRYHRNAANLGFVGACNAGADLARGEFLVFLNNDTVVTTGWLDALIGTFEQHRQVGLVGAKLVYPDGRLQEAGGIIFADGSGWNYGRFADPAHPAFNYVREVDYCSGAAIAIRRELFSTLGQFDQRYAPAYYEDTDLAFKVREHGLRVFYQPASTVIHFEGVTSGTDTGSGTKRYQVINQGKFLERWRLALAQQPAAGSDIDIAREHRVRGRILVIDATTPEPDKDSGSVRLINIFRALLELGYKVTFFAENRLFLPNYSDALQSLGVEVMHGSWLDPVAFLKRTGSHWQAVFVCRHYVLAPLLPVIRECAPRARLIFDTVDLHYLREQRAAELERRPELARQAARTQLVELRLARQSDITLVVSPVEQALLAREVPGARVDVLSNVHEIAGCRTPFADRKDLYFIGGFQHSPNVDAVLWFTHSIWPKISAALPGVTFHIVGSRMPETVKQLASETVVVHGFVASVDPFLDGCRLSVAPLRYGAGVKGKVNQSMAHGQPVVATTIAAEGMNLVHDRDILIADLPEAFADAVIRLYRDEACWHRLSSAGLANVRQHFSFDAAKDALVKLLS